MTTKLGSSDKRPGTQTPTAVPVRTCRFYAAEMMFSMFVLSAASYGVFSVNKWSFSVFLTLQGEPHIHRAVMPAVCGKPGREKMAILMRTAGGAPPAVL